MQRKNSDVFVVLSIVVLNIIWMILPYHTWEIGIVLALPLVFFIPGYTAIEILAHKRGLSASHRFTFSLGLSIAIDILGGFLLNVLPMGLRTQSWVVMLSCLALIFTLIILYLRKDNPHTSAQRGYRSIPPVGSQEDPRGGTSSGPQGDRKAFPYISQVGISAGVAFGLAAVLVVLSLFYATRGVAEQPRPGFTQLWMLPATQTGQHCTVQVGIHSFENASVSYHALMTVNNTQTMSWSALVLTSDTVWERSVAITATSAKNVFVEVRLYRDDKPAVVYREVHVTLYPLGKDTIVRCGT